MYYFYSKTDLNKEAVSRTIAMSRYAAAKYFADRKGLSLKAFLQIYSISR